MGCTQSNAGPSLGWTLADEEGRVLGTRPLLRRSNRTHLRALIRGGAEGSVAFAQSGQDRAGEAGALADPHPA